MIIDLTGKGSVYTKAEIDAMLATLETPSYEVVSELPVTGDGNIIYLLPVQSGDSYEQWIYTENDGWVKIGETAIELDDYVTDLELGTILEDYATISSVNSGLAAKQDTLTAGDRINISTQNVISADSQIISLTQAEYDALGANIDPDMVYVITDASPVVLATVATTGSYNDLTDKPALSTVATSGAYADLSGTPTLATVATSGSYNDLTNKPAIPTANDKLDVSAMSQSELADFYTNYATVMASKDVYWGVYPVTSIRDYQLSGVVYKEMTYQLEATLNPLNSNPVVNTNVVLLAPDGQYIEQPSVSVEMLSKAAIETALASKQDTLTAGTGITISNNVISADVPAVGTGTVTLTQNGATIGTINVNDSSDKTIDIPAGGGDTEEIEQAIAAAINDTRDSINQDLHNNYVQTQTMNDALKAYAPKAGYYTKAQVDTAIGSVYAEIEDKERATSFALNDLEENKQDVLTAGAGISIGTDGTISADVPAVGTGTVTLTQNGTTIGTFGLNDSSDKTIDIPAGGSSSNEWYGSQYQFDTLGTYDADTDYYISDIQYSEIKGTPNLDAFETKAASQAADTALNAKIAGKMDPIVFVGTGGLPTIGTPLEGVTYAIEGETLPLTFTLDGIGTVTYNFVID